MSSKNYKPLHQYDLGAPMSEEDVASHLRTATGHDAMRAVLQHLRNKAASMGFEGRQPPAGLVVPGDYRAYHDGAEDALGEVFSELHEMVHSVPEDEGEERQNEE